MARRTRREPRREFIHHRPRRACVTAGSSPNNDVVGTGCQRHNGHLPRGPAALRSGMSRPGFGAGRHRSAFAGEDVARVLLELFWSPVFARICKICRHPGSRLYNEAMIPCREDDCGRTGPSGTPARRTDDRETRQTRRDSHAMPPEFDPIVISANGISPPDRCEPRFPVVARACVNHNSVVESRLESQFGSHPTRRSPKLDRSTDD